MTPRYRRFGRSLRRTGSRSGLVPAAAVMALKIAPALATMAVSPAPEGSASLSTRSMSSRGICAMRGSA